MWGEELEAEPGQAGAVPTNQLGDPARLQVEHPLVVTIHENRCCDVGGGNAQTVQNLTPIGQHIISNICSIARRGHIEPPSEDSSR
jgi:hypothetical protein